MDTFVNECIVKQIVELITLSQNIVISLIPYNMVILVGFMCHLRFPTESIFKSSEIYRIKIVRIYTIQTL